MNVEQLSHIYLEAYAKPHKKTWKEKDLFYLNRYILPAFGSRVLDTIARGEVELFHKSFGSQTMANQAVIVMSSMFNRGIDWELCLKNPASRIKKFKEKPRTQYISMDNKERFMEALFQVGHPGFIAMIKFQLLTGCRKKEALNLKWIDVDKRNKILTFCETKNGTDHTLPLTDGVERLLNTLPPAGDYVFFGSYQKDVRHWMRKLKELYGDPTLRLANDLRRTAASYMLQRGANRSMVAEILNHKDERSTRIYTLFEMKNKIQGLDLLD